LNFPLGQDPERGPGPGIGTRHEELLMRAPVYPRLAAELASRGVTRAKLAKATGTSPGHISEVIRGKAEPSAALMQKMARALDVDVDELFALNADLARLAEIAAAERLWTDADVTEAADLEHPPGPEVVARVMRVVRDVHARELATRPTRAATGKQAQH
jgi:transcriptional regulator with XRE-family HTH domain